MRVPCVALKQSPWRPYSVTRQRSDPRCHSREREHGGVGVREDRPYGGPTPAVPQLFREDPSGRRR